METFVLVITVFAVSVSGEFNSCCLRGLPVLVRKHGSYSCFDAELNRTSAVFLGCKTIGHVYGGNDVAMTVGLDSELVLRMKFHEVIYKRGNFCLAQRGSRNQSKVGRPMALVCYEEEVTHVSESTYGYIMAVSVVFLMGGVAYAFGIGDLLEKSIVSFSGSLAIGLGIMAAMKLVPYSDMNLCAVRGFLAYYFLLASLFWMSSIALQITLAIFRQESETNIEGRTKYACYALFAWGVPAILTIAMALINFLPGDHLRPGIGLNTCWFIDLKQQWIYFYSVVAVLVVVNAVMFTIASIHIWQHPIESVHLKNKFAMAMQLFVASELPWVFEMVSSLTKINLGWEIINIAIACQGIYIFVVLMFTPPTSPQPRPAFKPGPAIRDTIYVIPKSQYIYNLTVDQPYTKMVEDY